MKALWVMVVALMAAPGAVHAQPLEYNLFENFVAMKLPQKSVPVGAKWVPGIGPTGPAAPIDNTTISDSVSNLKIDSSLKKQLALSIGSFFGLSADKSQTLDIDLESVTIVRVADLTRLNNVRAGDQLLYLAVKAGSIKIRADNQTGSRLKSEADLKNIPVSVSFGSGGGSIINLDGSNLYVAYQVMSLGQPEVSQKVVRHDGHEVTIDNTYRFRFCQCQPGSKLVIEWQNLRDVGMGGQIISHAIEHHPVANRLNEYPLDAYFSGSRITAARVTFAYDARQECVGGITDRDGKPIRMCGPITFPASRNKITLTTTSFRISPVRQPIGPF